MNRIVSEFSGDAVAVRDTVAVNDDHGDEVEVSYTLDSLLDFSLTNIELDYDLIGAISG